MENNEVLNLEVVKPMGQLSVDEIKELPVYEIKLLRNHNRKTGLTSYRWSLNLGGLNVSDRLDESEYKLILLRKKVLEEKDEVVVKVFARFIKGNTQSGKDYYMFQIFFVNDVYKSKFFTRTEANLLNLYQEMNKLDKKINWLKTSVVADDATTLSEDEVAGF